MASLPLEVQPLPSPPVRVAHTLLDCLRAGEPIEARQLRQLFEQATGRTDANAAWSMRHAYDALELALAMYVSAGDCPLLGGSPEDVLNKLEAFTRTLPAQSHRSDEQIALQQFSTPLPLAYVASLMAAPGPNDVLVEPSAGNGLLAAPAAPLVASLVLNELDARRRIGLLAGFPASPVWHHDAELIDDLLDPTVSPTLVLINPPFARSVGRGVDPHACGRHLSAAFRRLRPGGRLVGILPAGFELSRWLRQTRFGGAILLDCLLPAGLFARHGTGIAVRIAVLDKTDCSRGAAPRVVEQITDLLQLARDLPPRLGAGLPSPQPPAPGRQKPSLFTQSPAARPLRRPQPHTRTATATAKEGRAVMATSLPEPRPPGEQVGIYLPWRASRLRFDHSTEHPTPLVESLAMGSIAAPLADYRPILPEKVLAAADLSDAQLETLIYAGAAFGRDLAGTFDAIDQGCALKPSENGTRFRCGFFLGDGTGAGKGRQIAGVILDQWLRGNRRHIWISKNEALLQDARRDWTALGGLALDVQPLSQWKLGAPIHMDQGILFLTYPTLRSGKEDVTRLAQLLAWAGGAFDGVLAFDEAHAMANALGGEGSRGRVKGSEQGMAGLRLQNLLPRACVLYASATGASDIANLSYASRLGLWGLGTAFADRESFIAGIRSGGIAAMELVARDLKAQGLYTARALSFAGVEYELLEHPLSQTQVATYDAYADAWAIIHQNLEAALEATRVVDSETGATLNAAAKSAALSRFEGVKQRFFGQLLLSAKLPSLLPAIQADLADDHAVVVQLVSTAEAMLGRRLAELDPAEREQLAIDLSPREYVVDYLLNAFPTRQMRVFTDDEGNTRSEPMSDAEGRPIQCRSALAARDALVEQLCALPAIGTALDMIIERFGTEQVAEVTGRTRRLVTSSTGAQSLERRSARSSLVEADAFMNGTKRILVFSDAGGTGRSYHASLTARNQARRVHYLLEPGWRADAAIQGLGRTHRSAQASAPLFRPVTTDVRGERRFISTIARRLDSLGALTRGQRQTGGQNLFDPADNLESDHAKNALGSWYRLLYAGKLQSITFKSFQIRTGLRLEAEDGGLREDMPPIQRWLNRILALPIALQNAIFDEFMGLVEARVAAARAAGTLDLGLETLAVEQFRLLADRTIRTDPVSGATTHLLTLELVRRLRVRSLDALTPFLARPDACPVLNERSGKVALRIAARSLLNDDGQSIGRYELIRPGRCDYLSHEQFGESRWEPIPLDRFRRAWTAEADEIGAARHTETLYLAIGLLLPIWDKLPEGQCEVLRIVDQTGASVLGRAVPPGELDAFNRKLGLDIDVQLAPSELVKLVQQSGKAQPLGRSGLSLKRALVGNTVRLELVDWVAARLPEYKALGCFTEIIRYQTRLFVPVDRASDILARLVA